MHLTIFKGKEDLIKMQPESASHLMLFCALLLVRNSSATLQQSMMLVPGFGSDMHLAGKLGGLSASPEFASPTGVSSNKGVSSAE